MKILFYSIYEVLLFFFFFFSYLFIESFGIVQMSFWSNIQALNIIYIVEIFTANSCQNKKKKLWEWITKIKDSRRKCKRDAVSVFWNPSFNFYVSSSANTLVGSIIEERDERGCLLRRVVWFINYNSCKYIHIYSYSTIYNKNKYIYVYMCACIPSFFFFIIEKKRWFIWKSKIKNKKYYDLNFYMHTFICFFFFHFRSFHSVDDGERKKKKKRSWSF